MYLPSGRPSIGGSGGRSGSGGMATGLIGSDNVGGPSLHGRHTKSVVSIALPLVALNDTAPVGFAMMVALDVTTRVVSQPSMCSVVQPRTSTLTLMSPSIDLAWSNARFAAACVSKPASVPVLYTVSVYTVTPTLALAPVPTLVPALVHPLPSPARTLVPLAPTPPLAPAPALPRPAVAVYHTVVDHTPSLCDRSPARCRQAEWSSRAEQTDEQQCWSRRRLTVRSLHWQGPPSPGRPAAVRRCPPSSRQCASPDRSRAAAA
eukprot:3174186-Prymnesium_polylepis.1